jgi:hypothetical protein
MSTFAEILDAADGLSVDEQETLLEILRHRIAERNRAKLVGEVSEARGEFANGQARFGTAKEIMDEARREAAWRTLQPRRGEM